MKDTIELFSAIIDRTVEETIAAGSLAGDRIVKIAAEEIMRHAKPGDDAVLMAVTYGVALASKRSPLRIAIDTGLAIEALKKATEDKAKEDDSDGVFAIVLGDPAAKEKDVAELLGALLNSRSDFRAMEIERQATRIANDQPMSFHADSCPYLISDRIRNCRCNCFSFARDELRRKAGL